MDENEVRKILWDIFENGNFPDDTVEERHFERFYGFNFVSDNKVRFSIHGHPHLFGSPTVGVASSAYIPEHYLYKLDINKKEVVLISKETDEPVINLEMLADEDVSNYFDYSGISEYEEKLLNLNSENEVIEFAKSEFQNLDWEKFEYVDKREFPELDISILQQKYLAAAEKEFIRTMVTQWKIVKDNLE